MGLLKKATGDGVVSLVGEVEDLEDFESSEADFLASAARLAICSARAAWRFLASVTRLASILDSSLDLA